MHADAVGFRAVYTPRLYFEPTILESFYDFLANLTVFHRYVQGSSMHTSRPAQIATRRPVIACANAAAQPNCVMQLTVDASTITALRQLVMRFCGEAMEFMRVAICPDTRKAKVWLCIRASMAGAVMDLILRSLPAAEFGRVKNQSIQ
jgi:hypothetical protein